MTGFLTLVVIFVIYRRFRLTDKWDVKPEDVIFNPKTKYEEFSPDDLPRTTRTTIIAGTIGNLYIPKKKFCQIAVLKGLSRVLSSDWLSCLTNNVKGSILV